MARRIVRRSFAGGRAQRRQTRWGGSPDVAGTTTVGAGVKLLLSSFSSADLADLIPNTVVRIRGSLWVRTDQIVASEDAFGAYGIAVVTEQARAAGAASLPGPITDEGSDVWLLWVPWFANMFLSTAAGFDSAPGRLVELESKAMRKIEEGQALVTMIENASSSASAVVIQKKRTLFKLH